MRSLGVAFCSCTLTLTLLATPVVAQTREAGPWWPHPIWGPEDQAGASNWITPAKVLEAIGLVETGRIYELGQTYEQGMPLFGERTYALNIVGRTPAEEPYGANQLVGNEEFLCAQIGQVGTQFDGLAHVGTRVQMGDGSLQDVYYNGFTGDEVLGAYGMRQLGIERIKPIITRGILIDIASLKGVDRLANGYEVSLADVRAALAEQRISEDSIRAGDALFFRFGWSTLWGEPEKYNDSPAGIGLEVARWVAERQASMIGTDSSSGEVIPNPDPTLAFPVHQELLTKNGIFNLENLTLEELAAERVHRFLFVFTPVPFKGATGSPGRPIAIR